MGDVLLSHPPKALCWVGEIVSKVGERDQSSDISWDLGNVLETVHESGTSHDVTWWASSWRRGALSTNCPCPLLGGEGWVWVRLGFLWEEQESSMGKEMLFPPKMLVLATEITRWKEMWKCSLVPRQDKNMTKSVADNSQRHKNVCFQRSSLTWCECSERPYEIFCFNCVD